MTGPRPPRGRRWRRRSRPETGSRPDTRCPPWPSPATTRGEPAARQEDNDPALSLTETDPQATDPRRLLLSSKVARLWDQDRGGAALSPAGRAGGGAGGG